MGNTGPVDRVPLAVHDQRARKAYRGDGKFATSRPVGWSKVVGGVSEVADGELDVGDVGGPSKLSEVCSGIRERIAASKSRVQEGRTWLGGIMSNKVKRDRTAKQDVLRQARGRLAAHQKTAEAARLSRARDWMGEHVVLDRKYSRWWDEVVKAVPVGRAAYEAVHRSPVPCEGSVGRWTLVTDGRRNVLPRGQAMVLPGAPLGPSPKPSRAGVMPTTAGVPFVCGGQDPPVPMYASFSAFLEDVDDDPSDEAVNLYPPEVPVVRSKVACARVAHDARLGTLEWKDLKDKAPACMRDGSQGMRNSAEEAVWEVLSDIGTGSPGWNRCSAAKAKGAFVKASESPPWSDARRSSEAEAALRVMQESLHAKAKCLRENSAVGGHRMCGGDDFYTAMHEHNVVLEKETSDAIGMLAEVLLAKTEGVVASALGASGALGVSGDSPVLKIPAGETAEGFSMELPDDTAARRVRLSLARRKYEHMVSVADIDELEDAECEGAEARGRLRKKLVERQKAVVLSEMRQSCTSSAFQCEKGVLLRQLGVGCAAMAPERESVVAMSGAVAEGSTRVRRFAADSACNVHLTGDEGDLSDAKTVHFKVVGTAGASDVTKTGTVVGTAVDVNGESIDFKFKCSALKGLSMNLLSISQLLTNGSIVHLEQGNSYILIKVGMNHEMRKIVLEESNGLFFLPLNVESGDRHTDPVCRARAHLSSACSNLVLDANRLMDVGNTAVGADTSACAFAGSNAATLELWHHRLGCSKQKISLMHKESSVLGLGVSGSTKAACKGGCKCSVCQLSRACKRSPAKMRVFEQECTRPFGVVFTDIKGPLMESHCGLRYSIVFIDQVTRSACTYYMSKKSDAADKLKRYLSYVKKLGWCVGLIRADRGSEYFGLDGEHVQQDSVKTFTDFERVADENGVTVEASPRHGSTGNGLVERYHRIIFEIASSFLRRSRMSPLFWVEAYKYAEFLYNRMTTAGTGEFTPHELVHGHRPRFDRVKVFGCDMYEHLDGLPKVPGGTKARKGFFLGIPSDSPSGYLMYDINAGVVRTVFSATFDESFVRRDCGIRVYDQARAMDSAKRRGKALGNKQVVTSELVFGEPDDPLIMGTARRMLSEHAGWETPALAPRGDTKKCVSFVDPKGDGKPASVSAVTPRGDGNVSAVTPRGDGKSDGPEEVVKQEQNGVIDGPPDNGPDESAVDVDNLPKGREAVGLRVAKDFRQGVFVGTVTKYLPPAAHDDVPLWQIVYDDGDSEQWEKSELKEGVSLFQSEPSVGFLAESGRQGPDKKIRRFVKDKKDLYDFSWVSASQLTEQELEEYKLHLLTHKLTHAVDDEVELEVDEVDHDVDGPLGKLTREREESRRLWEDGNCRIRPFRPFSAGVGKKRALSDEDRLFLTYALENNVPSVYVWRNPKREATKEGECDSYKRYELYKGCTALRDVINISVLSRPKGMKQSTASGLAMRDIKWDYERGFLYFPLNESGRLGHWIDAKVMAADRGAKGEAMRFTGEQPEVAMSGLKSKVKRQFDWPPPKNEKVVYSDTEGVWVVQSTEVQAFGNVLDEISVDDSDEDQTAMLGKQDTFGDVLDQQYQHDTTEWWNDPMVVAHLADSSLKKVMYRHPDTGVLHAEPAHVNEAMRGPDAKLWRKSMEKEIAAMSEFGVWEDVLEMKIPTGTKLLGTKWVLKIKSDRNGFVERFKSRLVVLGYMQREHVHYDPAQTYSPVMSYDSFRMILSIGAAQNWEIRSADITSAFLQGTIDKELYMRHPLGDVNPDGTPKVVKLLKGQYGLIQSPRLFHNALQKRMEEGGLEGCIFDPCVFKTVKTRQWLFEQLGSPPEHAAYVESDPTATETMLAGCWVDDVTEAGSSNLILDWFIWHLRQRFTINEKSTGECEYMLSARIVRDREKGVLYMDQSAAITRLAQKCGLDKDPSKTHVWPTPMHVDLPTKHTEKTTDYDYLSVVGAALHICGVSRPDCSFSVGCLARHSKTAGAEHVEALERLVSYLYQTRFKAIVYRSSPSAADLNVPQVYESGVHPLDVNKENPTKVFVDSDFAGADGRSTAGHVVFLNGGPVIWSSKLMKVAATSSAEAEVIAAVESVKTASHFRCLLVELGMITSEFVDVHEDNRACKMSAESLKCHKRARHYQSKLRYLQDCHQNGSIKFHQTSTNDMIADIFTKALPKPAHDKHASTLLSDLPQAIVDMTLSSDSQVAPEDRTVEEEDCKPAFEGVPEFEGSPSPQDSSGGQERALEYACMARVGLGREFYDMMVEAMADD